MLLAVYFCILASLAFGVSRLFSFFVMPYPNVMFVHMCVLRIELN